MIRQLGKYKNAKIFARYIHLWFVTRQNLTTQFTIPLFYLRQNIRPVPHQPTVSPYKCIVCKIDIAMNMLKYCSLYVKLLKFSFSCTVVAPLQWWHIYLNTSFTSLFATFLLLKFKTHYHFVWKYGTNIKFEYFLKFVLP